MLYCAIVPEPPRRVIVPAALCRRLAARRLAADRRAAERFRQRAAGLTAGWRGRRRIDDGERERAVAVAPAASVTATWKVDVPSTVGAPTTSPEGRSVSPAGSVPDQACGSVPPVARKLIGRRREDDRDAAARPGGERQARAAVADDCEVQRLGHGRAVDEQRPGAGIRQFTVWGRAGRARIACGERQRRRRERVG